mmetsp:Transcript_4284/g.7808  ORF Transcript_4284/g.7808 Transcript_4284/m.7808 type:complete len:525 (-) Transcript_4284:1356-2930(-)
MSRRSRRGAPVHRALPTDASEKGDARAAGRLIELAARRRGATDEGTGDALRGGVGVGDGEVEDAVGRQQGGARREQPVYYGHESEEVQEVRELLSADGPLRDVAGVVQRGQSKVTKEPALQLWSVPAGQAQHVTRRDEWAEGRRQQAVVHLHLIVLQRHDRLKVALRVDLLRVVLVREHGDEEVGHQDGGEHDVEDEHEDGVQPQHGVHIERLVVLGGREDVEAHLKVAHEETEEQHDDVPNGCPSQRVADGAPKEGEEGGGEAEEEGDEGEQEHKHLADHLDDHVEQGRQAAVERAKDEHRLHPHHDRAHAEQNLHRAQRQSLVDVDDARGGQLDDGPRQRGAHQQHKLDEVHLGGDGLDGEDAVEGGAELVDAGVEEVHPGRDDPPDHAAHEDAHVVRTARARIVVGVGHPRDAAGQRNAAAALCRCQPFTIPSLGLKQRHVEDDEKERVAEALEAPAPSRRVEEGAPVVQRHVRQRAGRRQERLPEGPAESVLIHQSVQKQITGHYGTGKRHALHLRLRHL